MHTKLKIKHKKKQGFTLLELISVIAIITILATAILPKVTGYINEAKKTKVLDQCRKAVMAVESYNLTHSPKCSKEKNILYLKGEPSIKKYLEDVEFNNLYDDTTVENCYQVLNGYEFNLDPSNEKLQILSLTKPSIKNNGE